MKAENLQWSLSVPRVWRAPASPISEWFGWVGQVAAQVLGELTARPVRIVEVPARDRSPSPGRTSCWLRIAVADDPSSAWSHRLTVALDVGAARAVLDGLLARLAGFRSDGQLLDTDRALLQYAVLEVLDAVVRNGGFSSTVFMEAFGIGDCPASDPRATCCSARISVGPLGGDVTASLELAGHAPLANLPLPLHVMGDLSAGPLPSLIPISLRAPFVAVSRHDWEVVAAGDLVLAGGRSLEGIGRAMRLTTESGWAVAGARVVHHGPREIEVELLDQCREPDDPPPALEGHGPEVAAEFVCLRPLVATARLAPMEYERLFRTADRPRTLALSGGSGESVRLCIRERVVATAEMVRHDDDLLAYRVVKLFGGSRPEERVHGEEGVHAEGSA